jgi:DNA-binding LacI/PurR family transcriptional regulator/biotin operon repressor
MNKAVTKKDAIYDLLSRKIISGEYKSGYKFPSEPSMAKELSVGRITLRSALERLEEAGKVIRVPGKGTFVNTGSDDEKDKKNVWLIAKQDDDLALPQHYIIPGIKKAAEMNNVNIEIFATAFLKSMDAKQFLQMFGSKKPDGVIYIESGFWGTEHVLKLLQSLKVPVVLPSASMNDYRVTNFATILFSTSLAWQDALKHLRSQGHFRIATLGIEKERGKNTWLRNFSKDEYFNLLKELGLSTDSHFVKFAKYDYSDIEEKVHQLINMEVPPTAIMCYSDFFALHVYRALEKFGMKIPKDIAVMGYCNAPQGRYLTPSLSTIDKDYAQFGKASVELLMKSDEWYHPDDKNYAPPIIRIKHKLIIRDSTKIKRFEASLQPEYV